MPNDVVLRRVRSLDGVSLQITETLSLAAMSYYKYPTYNREMGLSAPEPSHNDPLTGRFPDGHWGSTRRPLSNPYPGVLF